MNIHFHKNDLEFALDCTNGVAIDTEAMGLNNHRDRLCLVQISTGDGTCHLVQIEKGQTSAPRLQKILNDPKILKIFHYARFDVGLLKHTLGVTCAPLYCTKIASKLSRTYTGSHGLKDLCWHLLGVELSKESQESDWGQPDLTEAQLKYAATDVLYLHQLKAKLDTMLARENRSDLAQKCFDFIPTCTDLELHHFAPNSLFSH